MGLELFLPSSIDPYHRILLNPFSTPASAHATVVSTGREKSRRPLDHAAEFQSRRHWDCPQLCNLNLYSKRIFLVLYNTYSFTVQYFSILYTPYTLYQLPYFFIIFHTTTFSLIPISTTILFFYFNFQLTSNFYTNKKSMK
jgi:hypothetical protein